MSKGNKFRDTQVLRRLGFLHLQSSCLPEYLALRISMFGTLYIFYKLDFPKNVPNRLLHSPTKYFLHNSRTPCCILLKNSLDFKMSLNKCGK